MRSRSSGVARDSSRSFVALGLGEDDISAIRDTLAAYDRTNAMALIALSALLCNAIFEGTVLTLDQAELLDVSII